MSRAGGFWIIGVALFALAVGIGIGFALGRSTSEHLRYVYRTKMKIAVHNSDDSLLAVLPEGTPMLSSLDIDPHADLGWWGYIPVYLHDMADADKLVRKVAEDPKRLSVMKMLHGVRVNETTKGKPSEQVQSPSTRPPR